MAWLKRRRTWLDGPPKRLGRRGTILSIIGFIWVMIGLNTLAIATSIPDRDKFLYLIIPHTVRVAVWMITGGVALVAAWLPPSRSDEKGFQALVIMPLILVASYAWVYVGYLLGTAHGIGAKGGVFNILIWVAFSALIITASGWREPPPIPVHPGDDDG